MATGPKQESSDDRVTAKDVTRNINPAVQAMLWGKAAGRCEFAGCNRPLWKSSVTQEQVNVGQKAHIYSFSSAGPRGNRGIAKSKLNDLQNLMLLCHQCHRKIDKAKDGGRYTVALLRRWKNEHEHRIELATAVAPTKQSHVVLYGANIGSHASPLNFSDAAIALFPERYPAEDRAIELGTINSSFLDRDTNFWSIEARNLVTKIRQRIGERMAQGDIGHLSVFALAPQPLLIFLGSLLTDIPRADVFQLHREPAGWHWPSVKRASSFVVNEPAPGEGPAALVLALSATVASGRIASVLGDDVKIWSVTIPRPHHDAMKSRSQLREFRQLMRQLLDRIKARHGQATPLNVFPAAPVSANVEFGRVRQPKADMPWIIYDQVNELGGFIRALTLPFGD